MKTPPLIPGPTATELHRRAVLGERLATIEERRPIAREAWAELGAAELPDGASLSEGIEILNRRDRARLGGQR